MRIIKLFVFGKYCEQILRNNFVAAGTLITRSVWKILRSFSIEIQRFEKVGVDFTLSNVAVGIQTLHFFLTFGFLYFLDDFWLCKWPGVVILAKSQKTYMAPWPEPVDLCTLLSSYQIYSKQLWSLRFASWNILTVFPLISHCSHIAKALAQEHGLGLKKGTPACLFLSISIHFHPFPLKDFGVAFFSSRPCCNFSRNVQHIKHEGVYITNKIKIVIGCMP